jgi:hypothetical protein
MVLQGLKQEPLAVRPLFSKNAGMTVGDFFSYCFAPARFEKFILV